MKLPDQESRKIKGCSPTNVKHRLAGYLPGATVGDGDVFYGYYHFDVMQGGRQVGMLSVNAATGQVWYHTWHGEFLWKREFRPP